MTKNRDRFGSLRLGNPDRVMWTPRWAVVSTYPPTQCGLASFTHSLVAGMTRVGTRADVIRVVDAAGEPVPSGVSYQLVNGADDPAEAAAVLNGYDVVMLQHEYGIFGGPDGEDILAVLERLTVPLITVAHTVLADPTARQRSILEDVIAASSSMVTMTVAARDRLVEGYGVDPTAVHVIPHGAADDLLAPRGLAGAPRPGRRPVILTWGLLGTGKGIEWGIEALAGLSDLDPRPMYIVAGQTHPRVLEREGERYRTMLQQRARELGVAGDVIFEDGYLNAARLHRLVQGADVVLLPYDSVEQVTSGVLIEAVAAGRPVVSTGFPHAVELLADGVGTVVPQRDPHALSQALRAVLGDPALAAAMTAKAQAVAPSLSWSSVATRYTELGATLIRTQPIRSSRGQAGLAAERLTAERLAVVA